MNVTAYVLDRATEGFTVTSLYDSMPRDEDGRRLAGLRRLRVVISQLEDEGRIECIGQNVKLYGLAGQTGRTTKRYEARVHTRVLDVLKKRGSLTTADLRSQLGDDPLCCVGDLPLFTAALRSLCESGKVQVSTRPWGAEVDVFSLSKPQKSAPARLQVGNEHRADTLARELLREQGPQRFSATQFRTALGVDQECGAQLLAYLTEQGLIQALPGTLLPTFVAGPALRPQTATEDRASAPAQVLTQAPAQESLALAEGSDLRPDHASTPASTHTSNHTSNHTSGLAARLTLTASSARGSTSTFHLAYPAAPAAGPGLRALTAGPPRHTASNPNPPNRSTHDHSRRYRDPSRPPTRKTTRSGSTQMARADVQEKHSRDTQRSRRRPPLHHAAPDHVPVRQRAPRSRLDLRERQQTGLPQPERHLRPTLGSDHRRRTATNQSQQPPAPSRGTTRWPADHSRTSWARTLRPATPDSNRPKRHTHPGPGRTRPDKLGTSRPSPCPAWRELSVWSLARALRDRHRHPGRTRPSLPLPESNTTPHFSPAFTARFTPTGAER